jgi:hypothetical protein
MTGLPDWMRCANFLVKDVLKPYEMLLSKGCNGEVYNV